jgi:uncharacterized coiled-coil protein SlyX
VVAPPRDQLARIGDGVRVKLLTELRDTITRKFQPEARLYAARAYQDFDARLSNTENRMLEQVATTIDLTKGLSKLPSMVEELQTKMHQQVERLDSAMGKQGSSAATLLTNQPKPALASINTNTIAKCRKGLTLRHRISPMSQLPLTR